MPGWLAADVKIVAAGGLKNRDWMGKSDPYCELLVNGVTKGHTSVTWNSLNPQWDSVIAIEGLRPGDELEFKVWDDDTWFSGQNMENHRQSLGSCELPLPAVGEKKDAWLQVVGGKDEVGGGEPPQLHVVVEMKARAGPRPVFA